MQVMSSPVTTSSMKQYQISINSTCSSQYTDTVGKFTDDFNEKLKLTNTQDEEGSHNQLLNENPSQEDDDERKERSCHDDYNSEGEEEEEEEEFSFICANPTESLISAEHIFQNGQIRPMFPLFNQDLLYADEEAGPLFVEERSEADGPCCVWKGGRSGGVGGGQGDGDGDGEASSSEKCKKSNSTGFSKLRRFREFVLRSNSDGKDAFVFFNHNSPTTTATATTSATTSASSNSKRVVNEKTKKDEKKVVVRKKEKGGKKATVSPTSASAHERHYLRNRAIKGGDKRKSYLPYRQDIVGFFTNVNEFSKNVHPF